MKLTRKQLEALLLYVNDDPRRALSGTTLSGIHIFGSTLEAADGIGLLRLILPGIGAEDLVLSADVLRRAMREMKAEEYDLTGIPTLRGTYPNCDKLIPEKRLPGRGVIVLHMGAGQLVRIGRTAERLGAERVRLQFKQDAVVVRLDYGGSGSDDPDVVGVVARMGESHQEGTDRRAAKKREGA